MNWKNKGLLVSLFLSAVLLCGCSEKNETIEYDFFAMDTVCSVTVYDGSLTESELAVLTVGTVAGAEDTLTAGGGEKSVFASHDGETVTFSDKLAPLLEKSFRVSEVTDGAFDLTVAPLSALWNVKEATEPPAEEQIAEVLSKIGYEKTTLSGSSLTFSVTGSGVDMGAVGKGYTAGVLAEALKERGCTSALVNLGGNITLVGERKGENFRIGIRSPETGSVLGVLSVNNVSVVTSGGYERYFEYEGIRYHHILDPKSGYPVFNGLESVTVLCDDPEMADILSTALFVCGREEAERLFELFSTDGSGLKGAVYVTEEKEIILFGEAKDCFVLSEEGYTVQNGRE